MAKITVKVQKFVDEYLINGGNATAAYKHAYNTERMKEITIVKRSGELRRDGAVSGLIDVGREKLAEKALWTREEGVLELRKTFSDKEAKHTDRIAAVKELNNMHGYKEETVNNNVNYQIMPSIKVNGKDKTFKVGEELKK